MKTRTQRMVGFRGIALAALGLLVMSSIAGFGAALAAEVEETSDPLSARAYEIRHRPLSDVAELVAPLLSEDGKLSLQPRLKTLVVEDRVSVLDKVGAVLESFDLPPRNVELALTLFIGTDQSRGEAGRQALPDGVDDAVVDVMDKITKVMKWQSYELLGARSVSGIEGGRVTATLSDDYRVVFEIDSVEESRGKVLFKSFSVQKVIPTTDGVRYEDVYTVDMIAPLGRLHTVGVASGPDSSKALFLTLRVELR